MSPLQFFIFFRVFTCRICLHFPPPVSDTPPCELLFRPEYFFQNVQLWVWYITLGFEFGVPVIYLSLLLIFDILICYLILLFDLFGIGFLYLSLIFKFVFWIWHLCLVHSLLYEFSILVWYMSLFFVNGIWLCYVLFVIWVWYMSLVYEFGIWM